jgi:hypothetical protein
VVSSTDLFRNLLTTDHTFQTLYDVTRKNPHRSLYLAIVLQALLDITKPKEKKESSDIRLERDQAHAWVFASVGVTCENFEDTCALAGIEPGMIRTFAINVIKSGDVNEVRRKITSLL